MERWKRVAAALALALVFGALGCRQDGTAEPPRDESALGIRPGADGDGVAGGREQSGIYEVASIEGDELVLRRASTGEKELQSGREIRMTVDQFQRIARRQAREGLVVHVRTDEHGVPWRIDTRVDPGNAARVRDPGTPGKI